MQTWPPTHHLPPSPWGIVLFLPAFTKGLPQCRPSICTPWCNGSWLLSFSNNQAKLKNKQEPLFLHAPPHRLSHRGLRSLRDWSLLCGKEFRAWLRAGVCRSLHCSEREAPGTVGGSKRMIEEAAEGLGSLCGSATSGLSELGRTSGFSGPCFSVCIELGRVGIRSFPTTLQRCFRGPASSPKYSSKKTAKIIKWIVF